MPGRVGSAGAGLALIVALLASIACQPPISEGDFDSADPAAKLYAISHADRGDIPRLIEQLDSDDPAVRMYAIVALERLTGQRRGYSPYDPAHKRAPAVQRWADWHADSSSMPTADANDSVAREPAP